MLKTSFKGTVKLNFGNSYEKEYQLGAYNKTRHVGRIVLFFLISIRQKSKKRSMASFPKGDNGDNIYRMEDPVPRKGDPVSRTRNLFFFKGTP